MLGRRHRSGHRNHSIKLCVIFLSLTKLKLIIFLLLLFQAFKSFETSKLCPSNLHSLRFQSKLSHSVNGSWMLFGNTQFRIQIEKRWFRRKIQTILWHIGNCTFIPSQLQRFWKVMVSGMAIWRHWYSRIRGNSWRLSSERPCGVAESLVRVFYSPTVSWEPLDPKQEDSRRLLAENLFKSGFL